MSCPLPHVLILLNLLRRPVFLLGEASRRVIHPPVACRLLACLMPSCSLTRLASLLASLLVGLDGLAMGVGSVCDCGGRADVMRRLAACFSVRLRPVCAHRPAPSTRLAGRRAAVGIACFFRVSLAMRGFCGSRSLRLPGLLRHDILSLCRRGRMSAIAVHRNSLACFSIPISAPLFIFSPSRHLIAVGGHFQSFHARCSHWPLLSTRFAPFALPMADGAKCFLCLLFLR